ncbi:MAG TPA: hypothetical protein VF593_13875 [Chthoniobacteraceae bacterium]|jgi:hypothetical protein
MIPRFLLCLKSRLLPLWISASAALGLTSCALLEPGLPAAAVTVKSNSRFEVQASIERVFNEKHWRVAQRDLNSITLQRTGGTADQVMHGNWIDGEIAERVKVTITEKGGGRYRLRCLPSIVRDPSDVAFEDEHRRMQVFSFHLSGLLREVKRDLN